MTVHYRNSQLTLTLILTFL